LVAAAIVAIMSAGIHGASSQAPPASQAALVNPNTAAEAALAGLPHMTAARARALVAGRPFASMLAVDELLSGQGLTRPELTELYGRMFIPLALNAASDAEILLIPNLGNRMLREFKEYRPYVAMAQFRREIGKYVSDEEVARFERYVRID